MTKSIEDKYYEEDETVITTRKTKPVEKIIKKVMEIVMNKMAHGLYSVDLNEDSDQTRTVKMTTERLLTKVKMKTMVKMMQIK